jgi:hypothetical protein
MLVVRNDGTETMTPSQRFVPVKLNVGALVTVTKAVIGKLEQLFKV